MLKCKKKTGLCDFNKEKNWNQNHKKGEEKMTIRSKQNNVSSRYKLNGRMGSVVLTGILD